MIVGGAIQGCQLGEFLTKRGRQVTIVDTEGELGKAMYPERKTRLFYWFEKKGVTLIEGAKLVEITEQGLRLVTKEGETRFLEADNVGKHRTAGESEGNGAGGVRDRGLRGSGPYPRCHGRGLAGRQ